MKELDVCKRGNTAYRTYCEYLAGAGFEMSGEAYSAYYWSGLSVYDVIRMEDKNNKIEEAEIVINWKDQFGEGSKTFYSSKSAREFLERASILREFLKQSKR